MNTHSTSKKLFIVFLFCILGTVLLVIFIFHKDKSSKIQLQVSDLLQSDYSFHFTEASFGSTMTEVEQQQSISFPEIPYYCPEWVDGTLPDHPESIFDYRNRNDYTEAIEYTAYDAGHPVLIHYHNYIGHLGYQFEEGEMTTVIIRFGQKPSGRDRKMNYGGIKNDATAVYNQLYKELDPLLSAIGDIEKHENENAGIRTTTWSSSTEIDEGFITRLSIQEISDSHEPDNKQTVLYIYRIKYENGIWTSRNS